MKHHSEWASLLWPVVLLPYLVSFFLPVIELGVGNTASGGRAFFLALLGSFIGGSGHNLTTTFNLIPFLTWLANPLFWFGIVRLARGHWRSACLAGLAALLLGATVLLSWRTREKHPSKPTGAAMTVVNPDGTKRIVPYTVPPTWYSNTPWGNLEAGYYVWLASMAVLALVSLTGPWLLHARRIEGEVVASVDNPGAG